MERMQASDSGASTSLLSRLRYSNPYGTMLSPQWTMHFVGTERLLEVSSVVSTIEEVAELLCSLVALVVDSKLFLEDSKLLLEATKLREEFCNL